jgi:hypothetical protein
VTQQGEEASNGAPWWRSRGLPLLASAAKWLAVLVVASLMVPALTSQWSDRQKELDVKNEVVAQITHSAATATQDAYSLVDDESKSARIKDSLWRSQYRSIVKEWRVAAFTLESELEAYFPNIELSSSSLVNAFHEYNNHVQQYIRLSGDECADEERNDEAVHKLYGYLFHRESRRGPRAIEMNPPVPKSGNSPDPSCWAKPTKFRSKYQALGEELLRRREVLVQAVIHSNAAGFNVGFRDFVRQVLPFL